jgi:hypothetical protein
MELKKHPKYAELIEQVLADRCYQEVDGIYIIYKGRVDIVSTRDHTLLHHICVLENFGESCAIRQPAYEYLGDLYAGIDHSAPQETPCSFRTENAQP